MWDECIFNYLFQIKKKYIYCDSKLTPPPSSNPKLKRAFKDTACTLFLTTCTCLFLYSYQLFYKNVFILTTLMINSKILSKT